jgi:hypothetical protein
MDLVSLFLFRFRDIFYYAVEYKPTYVQAS